MVEGLFSLLFYNDSSINQYAVQKTLKYVFGESLVLLELGCLRYVVLAYHLRIELKILRKNTLCYLAVLF